LFTVEFQSEREGTSSVAHRSYRFGGRLMNSSRGKSRKKGFIQELK